MLKIGTLFSGGLAAVEWAMKYEELEHEVVFACEWDKYARKQYLEFHGEPKSQFYISVGENPLDLYKPFVWSLSFIKNKDVRQRLSYISGKKKLVYISNVMDKAHLDKMNYSLDLLVWGSPCQDLSLAGKRKGFDGDKSVYFRDGARIQKQIMPKAFVFENVKGLLSSHKGADYAEVIKTFQDMGYLIQMKVLNAKEHGTAQNRERVFIVGFLDEEAYHAFSFEDAVPLTKTLRDYLDDEVEEKYYLSDKIISGFLSQNNNFNGSFEPQNKDEVSKCLTSRYFKMGRTDPYIKEPILKQVGILDIKGADSTKRVYSADGICPTMTTMGGVTDNPKFFCLLLLR